MKAFHAVSLIPLLLFNLLGQDSGLRILVVEGDGAIINVKQRINPEAVVEVQDASGKPVGGANVVFFLPSQGPGGLFANGTNTLTATTDRLGRATARGMHPNNQTGRFEIRVVASYQGQTANTAITQMSAVGSSSSGGGGGGGMGFGTKAWIILGICVGAVAGAAIAATHGGSSGSTATPGIVLTAGTPTVGAPK